MASPSASGPPVVLASHGLTTKSVAGSKTIMNRSDTAQQDAFFRLAR